MAILEFKVDRSAAIPGDLECYLLVKGKDSDKEIRVIDNALGVWTSVGKAMAYARALQEVDAGPERHAWEYLVAEYGPKFAQVIVNHEGVEGFYSRVPLTFD